MVTFNSQTSQGAGRLSEPASFLPLLMRILELNLLTPDVAATARFYAEVLELPVRRTVGATVEVTVGYSCLRFQPAPPGPAPFYHFAFSLAFDQLGPAHAWTAARLPLLPAPTGETLFDFPNWQARAFYFHDATGNIVEGIARTGTRSAASPVAGSPLALTGICEIGIVVPNVVAGAAQLRLAGGVLNYSRGSCLPDFIPLGDDDGLIILSAPERGWLPTGRRAEEHAVCLVAEQAGWQFAARFPGPGFLA